MGIRTIGIHIAVVGSKRTFIDITVVYTDVSVTVSKQHRVEQEFFCAARAPSVSSAAVTDFTIGSVTFIASSVHFQMILIAPDTTPTTRRVHLVFLIYS